MTTATLSPRRPSGLRLFGSSVATIMVKELRSRFRGRRAFVIITVYLAVLALIAYGAYVSVAPAARLQGQIGIDRGGFGLSGATASATIGQAIFTLLSVFQLLLVCFIAPAFTAGAISLEREKQTLDLLVTTPMRPGGIVVGKLISALAFVFLLILAGIPVSALVLMYGGASIGDILQQQVVLFVSAIGFGAVGIFFSALVKRTQTATVLTYSTMLLLVIGTFLVFRFWTLASTGASDNVFGTVRTAPEGLLYLNPAVAMIEIVANTEIQPGDYTEIMSEIRGTTSGITCDGDSCFPTDGGGGVGPPGVKAEIQFGPVPLAAGAAECPANDRCAAPGPVLAIFDPQPISGHFWPRYAISFGILSLLLTLASMRLVAPTGGRFSLRRRQTATPIPVPDLDPEADQ
jgi:ABC-type transport system involved in multi-copper enzyme maturation permease subunit